MSRRITIVWLSHDRLVEKLTPTMSADDLPITTYGPARFDALTRSLNDALSEAVPPPTRPVCVRIVASPYLATRETARRVGEALRRNNLNAIGFARGAACSVSIDRRLARTRIASAYPPRVTLETAMYLDRSGEVTAADRIASFVSQEISEAAKIPQHTVTIAVTHPDVIESAIPTAITQPSTSEFDPSGFSGLVFSYSISSVGVIDRFSTASFCVRVPVDAVRWRRSPTSLPHTHWLERVSSARTSCESDVSPATQRSAFAAAFSGRFSDLSN